MHRFYIVFLLLFLPISHISAKTNLAIKNAQEDCVQEHTEHLVPFADAPANKKKLEPYIKACEIWLLDAEKNNPKLIPYILIYKAFHSLYFNKEESLAILDDIATYENEGLHPVIWNEIMQSRLMIKASVLAISPDAKNMMKAAKVAVVLANQFPFSAQAQYVSLNVIQFAHDNENIKSPLQNILKLKSDDKAAYLLMQTLMQGKSYSQVKHLLEWSIRTKAIKKHKYFNRIITKETHDSGWSNRRNRPSIFNEEKTYESLAKIASYENMPNDILLYAEKQSKQNKTKTLTVKLEDRKWITPLMGLYVAEAMALKQDMAKALYFYTILGPDFHDKTEWLRVRSVLYRLLGDDVSAEYFEKIISDKTFKPYSTEFNWSNAERNIVYSLPTFDKQTLKKLGRYIPFIQTSGFKVKKKKQDLFIVQYATKKNLPYSRMNELALLSAAKYALKKKFTHLNVLHSRSFSKKIVSTNSRNSYSTSSDSGRLSELVVTYSKNKSSSSLPFQLNASEIVESLGSLYKPARGKKK